MIFLILGMNVNADVCYCNNCTGCTDALNNISCTEVKLNSNIMNHPETCINDPENFNNKILDCQGHTIDGTDNPNAHGIYMDNKENNTVKNCRITDWGDMGIEMLNSCSNLLIDNNTLISNNYGIDVDDGFNKNITIQNNWVYNSTDTGIFMWHCSDSYIFNNFVYNSSYDGISLGEAYNNAVENNTINITESNDGLTIDSDSDNNSIVNNKVYNVDGCAFYLHSMSENNTVNSNIFCGGEDQDIYTHLSFGETGNSGDNNTCDTTYQWNDTGTTGCSYSCPRSTPAGTNVGVEFVKEDVNMTFSNVTEGGQTSVKVSTTGPSPLAGFNLSGNYYDITTTAKYTGNITICMNYNESDVGNESNLKLLHYENDSWVDVTTSLDTGANIICGTVTGLSGFIVAEPNDADGDGVYGDVDKCLGTALPEQDVPTGVFWPNHFIDSDGDSVFEINTGSNNDPVIENSSISLSDTYGCSCEEILYCKPGGNTGEYKHGCSQGTMNVWISQTGWSTDCLDENGKMTLAGEPQDTTDNDLDGIADTEDTDDDNDGIADTEDTLSKDENNAGKPDWWCRKHPGNC